MAASAVAHTVAISVRRSGDAVRIEKITVATPQTTNIAQSKRSTIPDRFLTYRILVQDAISHYRGTE